MSAEKTLSPPGDARTAKPQSRRPPPMFEQKTPPLSSRKPLVEMYFFSLSAEQTFESSVGIAVGLLQAEQNVANKQKQKKYFINSSLFYFYFGNPGVSITRRA